ncbi:MAG: GH3 auxin-responsive promoter family protein [Chloroflexi bacterium]|nr:GH3 auxin-responsive promoter family protein [Chloroflexota bacterium]
MAALYKAEPGVYRLTLSRRGSWPSEKEIQIVKRDLQAALKAAERHWSSMAVEEYLRAAKSQRYHVIFWIEAVQGSLL